MESLEKTSKLSEYASFEICVHILSENVQPKAHIVPFFSKWCNSMSFDAIFKLFTVYESSYMWVFVSVTNSAIMSLHHDEMNCWKFSSFKIEWVFTNAGLTETQILFDINTHTIQSFYLSFIQRKSSQNWENLSWSSDGALRDVGPVDKSTSQKAQKFDALAFDEFWCDFWFCWWILKLILSPVRCDMKYRK